MAAPRWRGIRFADPGFVSMGRPGGLTVAATGRLATVDGDDAIRQAILLLLTTRPGERVMRPTYGSSLHRLVFSPNNPTTAGLAIHYVRQALARWEPRVEVLDVDAGPDDASPERLVVSLRYRVRASQSLATLTLPVDLGDDAETDASAESPR